MNYLTSNNPPKGEVLLTGSSVFPGYFRNPEITQSMFLDGWLCTGDVAQINPNGSIKIIDRAKNIFKLSQGEYIAPEKLENIFIQSAFVDQIWIYGDSFKDHIIAFIVVNKEQIESLKIKNTNSVSDKNKIKQELLKDLNIYAF